MPDPLLWQQHDLALVLLSLLVSMGAAMAALYMAGLAQRAEGRAMPRFLLGSGALALGCGVWTMHYVGMLAFAICGQARFDPGMTLLSMLPSLAASWVALRLLVRERIGFGVLLGSGTLVGGGIGAMHYIGMVASELAPLMRYDLRGFLLSIVVAVLLSVLALWVRFGLHRHLRLGATAATVLGGGVMGLAIAGMHYTGIAALRFVMPIAQMEDAGAGAELPVQTPLALAIVVVAVVACLAIVAINISLRYRQMYQRIRRSESRLRAMADTAVDAIITIDGRGCVRSFNPAAERIFGWRADEVLGRNVSMLMPEPHRAAHDGYLHRHLQTGHASIIGTGRDVEAQHRDGRRIPMRLAMGRIEQDDDPGEVLFVGFLTDLSEHKALERAREQGQAQLRSLVGNLPGVAFRCRNEGDWPMLFISDAVAALTGWEAVDFLQGRVHFGQLIDPQDAARIGEDVEHALANGESYSVEYRITTRSGQRRWMTENGRGVKDEAGIVRWLDGVIIDVSETKARNAEFVGTVRALNRAMAVAEFDLEGRLLDANANFLALMGYEIEEILGQPHTVFCAAADPEELFAPFWAQLRQGNFQSGEYHRRGKDGRDVWLHATYNPILDADGKVFKVIKIATDLSERRAMEQGLREAKEQAEQAAAARASFVANMSHEFRTPMNAIIGFTEALLDSPLADGQRRQLATVRRASKSLLHLLNDVLDAAKLDKGMLQLEALEFSLRELCEHVLDALQISAGRKGLALRLDYPADEPVLLRGDALRLQQVLFNLLGNAIKFTERGEVLLWLRYRDATLWLEVRDTGIGMDAAALARVFEPFAQGDASTARRFGGSGLGTTIARQLVELMGGTITARSQPGQGSVFALRLPLPLAGAGPLPAFRGGGQDAAPVPTAPSPLLPRFSAVEADAVQAALDAAGLALDRGELPALARLQALLPKAALLALDEALEQFDFNGAQLQLQRLRAQLEREPA